MKISVVSFDITNTLLRIKPTLGGICVAAMKAQKIADAPDPAVFDSRVSSARRVTMTKKIFPTSERNSRKYWHAMLWEIFAGWCSRNQFTVAEEFVYKRLAEPKSWDLMPGVKGVLEALKFLGLRLVVLSNGDARWEKALKDKGILRFFDGIFISSKTGFAKPDPMALDNLCRTMGIQRGELLHVGDSLSTDAEPAKKFGAQAAWYCGGTPKELPSEGIHILEDLCELPYLVRENLVEEFSTNKLSRSTKNLLALLGGIPVKEDDHFRQYRELDREKKIPLKFITSSEERRERDDTEPWNAAPLFGKVLTSRGLFRNSLQETILKNWDELVPARFVDKCSPSGLVNSMSTLRIFCKNTVVRQELEFYKATLLKKLKGLKGGEKIKKICFE